MSLPEAVLESYKNGITNTEKYNQILIYLEILICTLSVQ